MAFGEFSFERFLKEMLDLLLIISNSTGWIWRLCLVVIYDTPLNLRTTNQELRVIRDPDEAKVNILVSKISLIKLTTI